MQTVLITGGTGLIGNSLSRHLLQMGYRVIILTRDPGGKQPADNISYAKWDLKTQWIDPTAISAADHIIHLAGAGVIDKKWTGAYKKEIIDSRTNSSKLIIESLKHHLNKVKTVISASAIGWYGEDKKDGSAFMETDQPDDGFVGETCRLWEKSIQPVTESGIRLVILRTGIVLSAAGGAFKEFKRPLQFGVAAMMGSGKQMVSWLHVDDLCNMYTYALENENMNGSYNAVSPHPVSNKELTLTLAHAANKFYVPLHVPSFVLKIMLGQRSIEVLKSATVSSNKIEDAGFQFKYSYIKDAVLNLLRS
jgi:uncharacterized protein (TIGR01777 family)